MGNAWSYDMCQSIKRAPKLALAVNLLAAPIVGLWLWLGFSQAVPSAVFLTVLIALLLAFSVAGYVLIEVFHEFSCLESCAIILFPPFVVFYWFASLVALIRVLSGKAEFPDRAS